jgi:hypothetical protein
MLFMLVCCIALTWVGMRLKEMNRQWAAAAKLEAKGTYVSYKYGDVVSIQPFGNVSAEDLNLLKDFPHLEMLFLQDSHLGDSALRHTQGLNNLEWLVLNNLPITDGGLRQISGVPHLHNLYLSGTLVTDNCISHFATLGKLEYLNIERTKITAAGIKKLHEILPNAEIKY